MDNRYADAVPQYFSIAESDRTAQEVGILRQVSWIPVSFSSLCICQILVDVPRTNTDMPLFHQDAVQRVKECVMLVVTDYCMRLQLLERVLYIWAIKHPASGYVQGINDLLTPFFVVFISSYVGQCNMIATYTC